jgi:XTP/dITP diphosphohydrolase
VKQLVIASHNAGKVAEIGAMLAPLKLKVLSAAEANINEPEETGSTFAENATLKAENASSKSKLPSLADDSGLVVPAIGGAPGIYSARWAGPDKNFTKAFDQIEAALADNAPDNRQPDAYFICTLALSKPNEKTKVFEGRVNGRLIFPPRGKDGFGYDPIFIPDGYEQTFAELDPAIKNRISHRAVAFTKLMEFLKAQL